MIVDFSLTGKVAVWITGQVMIVDGGIVLHT